MTRVLSGALLVVLAIAAVWLTPSVLFLLIAESLLVLGARELVALSGAGHVAAPVASTVAAGLTCASFSRSAFNTEAWLPLEVVLLSAFAIWVYSGIDVNVIPLTVLLYALGLGYFWFWAHGRIQAAAPEELAARASRPGGGEAAP